VFIGILRSVRSVRSWSGRVRARPRRAGRPPAPRSRSARTRNTRARPRAARSPRPAGPRRSGPGRGTGPAGRPGC